jgi:GTP-binding protein
LATNKIPFSIIFTKTDKISKIEIDNKLLNYKKELEKNWEILPEFFISSSEKYTGKEDILNYIDKINQSII